jgi:F0F1-type ATP synthase membrane subunit b/b'
MIAKLALLFALVVAAFAGGFTYGHMRGVTGEARANHQAIEDAQAAAGDAHSALAKVEAQLADLRQRHAQALADAITAINSRDADVSALQTRLKARSKDLRGSVNESPDCADLARLPLCHAVADRLWPAPAASRSASP